MMNKTLRILCVVLGIGLIWGVVWLVVATILGTIMEFINPGSIDPGEEYLPLVIALVGFICGVVFGCVLCVAERRKTILQFSLIRAVMLGFLASAAIPLLMGKDLRMIIILGPLGALSALASVAVVRRWARWRLAVMHA